MAIHEQLLLKNRQQTARLKQDSERIETTSITVAESDLQEVKGLGDASITKLLENWIGSKASLKTISEEKIKETISNPLTRKNILTFINS